MNCFLLRELPLDRVVRVWDTYFSELDTFATFHIYVCAAFLQSFSERLKQLDQTQLMMFLNAPPTDNITEKEIEMWLSQA
jgi:hypothetical protein